MKGFLLIEFSLFFDVLLKISIFAELGHDVNVVLGHEDLNRFKDIRVGQSSQSVDLIIEEVLLYLTLNFAEF